MATAESMEVSLAPVMATPESTEASHVVMIEPPPPPPPQSSMEVSQPSPMIVVSQAVVALIVRLLTIVCLIISVIILSTNNFTVYDGIFVEAQINFNDIYAYRYVLACGVIGMAYTLLQIVFAVLPVKSRAEHVFTLLDFYGDKVQSYILATGAAAGFGFSVDLNRLQGLDSDEKRFLNMANVAASFLLIGFILSAVSSIFSSFSLSKRG